MKTRIEALGLGVLMLWVSVRVEAAAPVISRLTLADGSVRLRIQSEVGLTNQIQCSTDLRPESWEVLTNLWVSQGEYEFVESGLGAGARFYRVVALPGGAGGPAGMVVVPAGWFTMGDAVGGGYSNELPLHQVYVSGFWLDRYEVRTREWEEVAQWAVTNGYGFEEGVSGDGPEHPVLRVGWYNAVKWCNARSEKAGREPAYYTDAELRQCYRSGMVEPFVKWEAGYRLPTEAEWEKAARGGASGHRYPWTESETITHGLANYYSMTNYVYDVSPTRGYHPAYNDGTYPYTAPVGSFAPNGYGLYDVTGNVREWCWDWFDPYYYAGSPTTDPKGPGPVTPYRVERGGGWPTTAAAGRVSARGSYSPASTIVSIGFRCALAVNE